MPGIGARVQSYTDVVALPATKTAGNSVTFQSDEMFPFENGSWDKAVIHMSWFGDTLITDTVTVQPMVSWNEGDSFYKIGSYTEFLNGSSGAGDTYHVVPFCPRLRIDIAFDGSGALTVLHDLQIDVHFYETSSETRRHFQYDSLRWGDTWDPLVGDSLPVGDSVYGDSFDLGSSSAIQVYTHTSNRAEIGDTIYVAIQHSQDRAYWRNYEIVPVHALKNGTGAYVQRDMIGSGDTTGLYRYVRAHVYGDIDAGYIESANNVFVHLVGIEK